MQTLAEIKAEIARLESLAKSIADEEKAAAQRALNAMEKRWEWQITWKNEYTVRVERRLTEECAAEIAAIHEANPGLTRFHMTDETKWHGMDYLLCAGGHIISSGGGNCLLDVPSGGWNNKMRKLTIEEAQALWEGKVPETLLMPRLWTEQKYR